MNYQNEEKRPIDEMAKETYSWWNKTFTTIKKTRVKTWKGVFVIAFIAGSVAAIIWSVSLNIQTISEAEGETAILSMSPAAVGVEKGETFNLDVKLNTQNNNVVAARAIVNYDPNYFNLVNWNTDNSVFAGSNICTYNGRPCEIIDDTSSGILDITLSKPSTGVNSSSGLIAELAFEVLQTAVIGSSDITLSFTALGNYEDSDVTLDDGAGTDILVSVVDSRITVNLPTCTSFTYMDWSECQYNGTQIRSILASSPENCTGGDPITSQTCDNICGNGYCSGVANGEDCSSCPQDCIGAQGGTCGACWKGECDGNCNPKKETSACADCAVNYCCGDGVCGESENANNCYIDCKCSSDADCDDSESCTADICDIGTGVCENSWPACGVSDGCCGPECTPMTDLDCQETKGECSSCFKGVCDGRCHPNKESSSCPDCQ